IDGFLAWLLDAQPTYKNGDLVLLQEILGHPWVIKYIAGVPGERISIKNDIIFVENRKIGALQKTDSKGNLLLPIKEGVIPKDNYFVAGTHSLSFDSRYEKFGLVPHHKIARKAWLIF
ncbi:MAG: S26 family signal peptidase, partial [Holosporales bacterium]